MRSFVLVLALVLGLVAPVHAAAVLSGEGAPIVPIATDDDYARLVEQTVGIYIVPAYRDLGDATSKLTEAVRAYCAAPDAKGGASLDTAFANTLTAWAAVDFLHFGPMGSEGRYERFAFWPDVHGTGARQLRRFLASEDRKLIEPGALAQQSAAVQGLPALEQLLYSGDKAILSDSAPGDFRCALTTAVAENLDTIASDAVTGWTGEKGWAVLITKPGNDNPVYRTNTEAATEMLKAILTGLEQMRDQKILPAVGTTPETAKASNAPYDRSGHTMDYLKAESAALQRFVAAGGMLEMLPEDQDGYATSALFEFTNLDNALDGAGSDIQAALADPKLRGKLVYATIVLASLRDLFQKHIAVAAGLTAGFNSLDGD
jgi:uncharacterized protein